MWGPSDMPLPDSYHLGKAQHISDLSLVGDIVHSGRNVVVQAPPNTGKSYAFINMMKASGRQFVFVADSIPLARDLASSYDLPAYYAGLDEPNPDKPFITILHHVPRFVDSEAILIVDEWHSLVTQYGFKGDVIDRATRTFKDFAQVVGLTGTEVVEKYTAFDLVKVTDERTALDVHLIEYNSVLSAIISEIEARPDKTHWISLYDKSKQSMKLVAALVERGFVSEKEVSVFNSDTKNSEDVRVFLETNKIGAGTKIVLSTYTQGFSVLGDGYVVHVVPAENAKHSVEDIVQVSQRFRDAHGQCRVNLYHRFPDSPTSIVDLEKYKSAQTFEAERQRTVAEELFSSTASAMGDLKLSAANMLMRNGFLAQQAAKGGASDSLLDDDKKNLLKEDLSINGLQVRYNVHQMDTRNAYLSRGYMRKALGRYNVNLVDAPFVEAVYPEEKIEVAQRIDAAEFEATVDAHLRRSKIRVVDDVSAKLIFLLNYFERPVIGQIVKKYGRTTANWNGFKTRVERMASLGASDVETRGAVWKAFPIGDRVTSEQIQKRMNAVVKSRTRSRTSKMSSNKSLRTLRSYCSISDRKGKGAGKYYEVLSHYPLHFPLKEQAG